MKRLANTQGLVLRVLKSQFISGSPIAPQLITHHTPSPAIQPELQKSVRSELCYFHPISKRSSCLDSAHLKKAEEETTVFESNSQTAAKIAAGQQRATKQPTNGEQWAELFKLCLIADSKSARCSGAKGQKGKHAAKRKLNKSEYFGQCVSEQEILCIQP